MGLIKIGIGLQKTQRDQAIFKKMWKIAGWTKVYAGFWPLATPKTVSASLTRKIIKGF